VEAIKLYKYLFVGFRAAKCEHFTFLCMMSVPSRLEQCATMSCGDTCLHTTLLHTAPASNTFTFDTARRFSLLIRSYDHRTKLQASEDESRKNGRYSR